MNVYFIMQLVHSTVSYSSTHFAVSTGGLDTQGPADEDQRQASDDLRGILRQGEFEYRLHICRIQPKIIEKGYMTGRLCWNFLTIYGARNRVGIGLSYRHARLIRPVELIPWN
jgi:hypothetical protein